MTAKPTVNQPNLFDESGASVQIDPFSMPDVPADPTVVERVRPDGIPPEAWLAMEAVRQRGIPPPEPSQLDRFLAHQRKTYGT